MKEHSLMQNSIFNVLYRILNIVFPFITSIYVARVLLPESIGKVAAAQNIVSYFTIIAAMGIPTYGIKVIAQYKVRTNEINCAFSELFVINFILTIVSSFVYFSIVTFFPFFAEKKTVYYITGISLVFHIINVDWFYQGIQEYAYITVRSFSIKILSLVCLFLLVKKPEDYLVYALITSGALVGNYLFNIIRIKKYVSFTLHNLVLKKHIKHIFSLFIASIAAEVYVLADTTMLDIMCGSSIVGYYTMSMKIMRIMRGLVVAVSAVFLPKLSSYYYNNKSDDFLSLANKGISILLDLSIPVALGIALVANDAIVVLFGKEYIPSINTTIVLSISVISVALSSYIGLQIFVILGKERITTFSTICGAIINIILNYFLIKSLEHFGAAIASAITELSVTLIQVLVSKRFIKLKFELVKPIISGIVMLGCIILVHQLHISSLVRLIIECFVGVTVYLGAMILQRESFICGLLSRIKHRLGRI